MYLPALKKADLARLYDLGRYRCVLLTNCESLGMIEYLHVLFIHERGNQTPLMAVAAEKATMLQLDEEQYFLGLFPGDGHFNMGLSGDLTELDGFAERALEAAAKHLGVEARPIRVPIPDEGPGSPTPDDQGGSPFSLN